MKTELQQRVFRKTALDRLSSPEQLDRLVTLTDARGWVALLTLGGVLSATVLWGLWGTVYTNVNAPGILFSQGGRVVDVMAPVSGYLDELRVGVSDTIDKGQVVAVVSQTEILQQFKNARDLVIEREEALRQLRRDFDREIALKRSNFEARKAAIERTIAAARDLQQYLERTLEAQEKQAKKGFIPRQQIEEQRSDLNRVRKEIAEAGYQLLKLEADELDLVTQREQQLTQAEQGLHEAERQAAQLRVKLVRDSSLQAPASGRVTEIKLTEGEVVQPGQAVLSIEVLGGEIQAMVYIPTEHGKKVKPGMAARIEPATVKKEEYGTLLGTVREVSDFPLTPEGMAMVLQNRTLVEQFSRQGSPYAARVDLLPAETPSGYRWSSGQGPDIAITSGTTVRAEIAIREQRPAELVIPLLKKYTGSQ